jgi:hypothetical protein
MKRRAPDGRAPSFSIMGYLFTWTCMKLPCAETLTTRIVVPVAGRGTLDQPR